MKIITRPYIYVHDPIKVGKFICEGQWADGHLAYSLLDANEEIIEEDRGMFVQIRYNGKLTMIRI